MRADAKLTAPVEDALQTSCDPGKRRMYRVYVPGEEGVWAPAVHSNCVHNELAAMGLRTMGPTPDDPKRWPASVTRQFTSLRVLVKRLAVTQMSVSEVVNSYSGAMRSKYAAAAAQLDSEGLVPRDYRLSAFLKGEKFNPMGKLVKPRMINPRSAVYNLSVATRLKPLEHALWRRWKVGHMCDKTRAVGKGLSGGQRARLIEKKMASVGDCVVVEVDGKAFEAHVTMRQLGLEQSVYRAAFPGDSGLAELLRAQLRLKGRTAGGVGFSRDGCRASGDFNTGMGNTILMGCFVLAAMSELEFQTPWTVLVDGDNCLLFVRRPELGKLIARFADCLSSLCGHEMTVEKPAFCLEEVCFGQSHPVRTGAGLTMVRDPFKVLSNAFCGYRHFHDHKFACRLIRSIAMAERAQNRGVPILSAYFDTAVTLTHHYKEIKDVEFFLDGHLWHAPPDRGFVPVSDEARISFELAFGLGVDEQLAMEARLCEGLRRDLVRVLDSGRWLESTRAVSHGAVRSSNDSSLSWLYSVSG